MNLWNRITELFASAGSGKEALWVYARCERCGEIVKARINLYNDLSVQYEDGEKQYFCRKTLVGENRCFNRIKVKLRFDKTRRLIGRGIQGGKFLTEEEALESAT